MIFFRIEIARVCLGLFAAFATTAFAAVPVEDDSIGSGPSPAAAIPANSAPLDLRGYSFKEPAFSGRYLTYPSSTYDYAFVASRNIDTFVRDRTAGIDQGVASGVVNGTASATAADSINGTALTRNFTTRFSVFVPMKDGGYALVSYDRATGAVTLLELCDGADNSMPIDRAPLQVQNIDYRFHLGTRRGIAAYGVFRDYMRERAIPVVTDGGTGELTGCRGMPDGQVHCSQVY